MSRNEIEDVLTLEDGDTVRHRRGAIDALLTTHARIHKPTFRRGHRDGDDRHERGRPAAHAAMRETRA